MKITGVESHILHVPMPKPLSLQWGEQGLAVALVHTDEGVTGLGYSLAFGGHGVEAIQTYLTTRLAPQLLGEDPLFVERLWQKMTNVDRGIKQQGIAGYALSALDIALWDIAGKVAGLPLYKLWGAVTDSVAAYGSGGFAAYSLEDLIGEAERYASMGCRYYKMKIHNPDPMENRRRVQALQKAVGDRMRLMVDVNQRLDVAESMQQAKLLEEFNLVWYEEPVLADDYAACAEVASKISIPVATGENHYTRYEFRELIERRAAHYLMPDLCRAQGFSETLRIGHLAAAYGLKLSPHLVHELSIQVQGAMSNGFLVEFMDWTPDDLFSGMPVCKDGSFRISDRPGHGLELHPDAVARYGAN